MSQSAMAKRPFHTPHDAEQAFYDALERRDLEAMMAVWAVEEEVVCIHPGGPRLTGHEEVKVGWRQIFASGSKLAFELQDQHCFQGAMLAIHIVHEQITILPDRGRVLVVATNVYLLTDRGWRMILHHASLAPDSAEPAATSEDQRILH